MLRNRLYQWSKIGLTTNYESDFILKYMFSFNFNNNSQIRIYFVKNLSKNIYKI